MFDFFKGKRGQPKTSSVVEYRAEFNRLTKELYDKFAIGDTPYDELLEAMATVEHEMNYNGGINWGTGSYGDYLQIIKKRLGDSPLFAPDQLAKIEWSIREIEQCGKELETKGESRRALEEPIDYLIARVVDWCRSQQN